MTKDEFKRLAEGSYKKLYPYIYSLVKDEQDTWDIVQDTMERALKSIDKIESSDGPEAFLREIAKNVMLDKKRRVDIKREIYEKVKKKEAEGQTFKESVLDTLVKRGRSKEISRAIWKLDKTERKIILLHYYFGKSLIKISERTGIKYTTVLYKHKKALRALKENLKKMR
ncbi:RNA polymerase sigma factor [Aminipila butyrica]|uniref:RNA polymerase sigma factor n=1 Tax=Aminipila butyrica TaxID=433296 RepID=A0A858BSF3_9FIRM|nr:RNA polymerase sigma factor [Aminipila butyrica]QIB68282.1 RNA polymerase sigma factor [Aminipila butyrica]